MDNTLPVTVQMNIGNEQKGCSFLLDLASRIVEKYTVVSQAFTNIQVQECGDGDGVYNYARTMCHHASLVMEFTDAWAEGDGERVVRCWRFFLLHFYSGGRTKYALEALLLQFQIFAIIQLFLTKSFMVDLLTQKVDLDITSPSICTTNM